VLKMAPAWGRTSPQREHTGSFWAGNSAQQASQIGTVERSGRGEPQRAQTAGSKAQLTASTGLRSTRTTARHAEVPDRGNLPVSAFGLLLKTHLTAGNRTYCKFLATLPCLYLYAFADSMANQVDEKMVRNLSPHQRRQPGLRARSASPPGDKQKGSARDDAGIPRIGNEPRTDTSCADTCK